MGEVGKGITAFKKGVSEGKNELEDKSGEETAAARDVSTEEKDKV
jgi:sec-independent protein translocase protein TatA